MKKCGINSNFTCSMKQTIQRRTYLVEEMVNPIGDTKRAENTSGKERQKSITDREIQNRCPSDFMEPPYTDPYVRWLERPGVSHPLLLDEEI
ncbi:hypothetical protein C3943_14740 [Lysinibacillus sp. B2A1]|nr:hypothetical protein C3943_14740 [Lysinibacillus sp. B2A1]